MRRGVVVGVGPSDEHDAALEYAVAQARRRACAVHLVLVAHPGWPGLDSATTELKLVGEELVRRDHELLVQCERKVAAWDDEVVVTTEIAHGPVVPSLVAAAHDADLVVLQHHRTATPLHLPTVSVTQGVAARTPRPVVAVPPHWHAVRERTDPVVAALEDTDSGLGVVRTAFAEARGAGAAVRVVRTWSYVDLETDDESLRHDTGADRSERFRRDTWEALRPLLDEHPDVPCDVAVVHGQAAYTLVKESREARLVVVGRHHPALPIGSRLGPVTRSVLARAVCPVEVVDTRDEARSPRATTASTVATPSPT